MDDNGKDSEGDDANECGSDSENRTMCELDAINQDSVDSNCNVNESERNKCEKDPTKSELDEMLNDSSEDILVVYDNIKQGVPQCVVKNDASLISRLTEKNSESKNATEPVDDKNSVNVDLNTWENAEKVLHAELAGARKDSNRRLVQFQPFVRVQKIDNRISAGRRLRSSSSPERKPRKRLRMSAPISPRSPRKLRAPRGKWYRER